MSAAIDCGKAPIVWRKNSAGIKVRVIDPRWLKARMGAANDVPASVKPVVVAAPKMKILKRKPHVDPVYRRACILQRVPTCPELRHAAPSGRLIATLIGEEHGFTADQIMSYRKPDRLVLARHHAMVELRRLRPNMSLPQIGKAFGRDHTSVINAFKRWPEKVAKWGIAT